MWKFQILKNSMTVKNLRRFAGGASLNLRPKQDAALLA
jgi:hypothetical protein